MKNSSKKTHKFYRQPLLQRHLLRYSPVLALSLLLGMSATGCGGTPVQYQATDLTMGTVVSVNIYASRTEGEKLPGEVMALIDNLEQDTLSWRMETSEIGKLNGAAGSGEPVMVSRALMADLEMLSKVSGRSDGAFDVTIGSLSRLWNIDEWAKSEAEIPAAADIEAALSHVGYENMLLQDGICLPEGMSIDLGAVGKGIACDRVAAYLDEQEVSGAVVSVGGSILTYGSKPDGTPWQVGIVDPEDTASVLGTLMLNGEWYVSTSGDYERYIVADGKRYHHILDPATGYPADSGLKSVTILCKSGTMSDALSTACFVLGLEDGMALAESYGAEALFVDTQGNLYMTEQMKKFFEKK